MTTYRFWVHLNGDFVKLSLRDGDCLRHVAGGATEEGYDWCENTWEHCGDHVHREFYREARDCDGRITSGGVCCARPDRLMAREPYGTDDPQIKLPEWEDDRQFYRDHTAEAAGY